MERTRERPPAYQHHPPPPLTLPDVPSHVPTAHRRAQSSQITLPDIRSLNLPDSHRTLPPISATQPSFPPLWPSTPRFEPSHTHLPSPVPRPSVEHHHAPSNGMDTIMHGESQYRAPSVISTDDAGMREAAETLSMFKNNESMHSPSTTRSTTVQPLTTADALSPTPSTVAPTHHDEMEDEAAEAEPLLELLTTQHPWIGGTVNGSLVAYHTALNYSPAFVRSSTNFVERTVGTPLANGVGAVASRIGLESGVRRILGERVPSDQDTKSGNKRRRPTEDVLPDVAMDIEKGLMSPSIYHYRSRAASQVSFVESLPAYDANRSPPYEENMADVARDAEAKSQLALQQRSAAPTRRGSLAYNWGQQLMITTSGLGVALSESSLRQLKMCLSLLSKATANLTSIMKALKDLLAEYQGYHHTSPADQNLTYAQQEVAAAIADKIRARGNEIMGTLHQAIDAVSKYAGGALPDNASALVRRQLMSVPQRWRVAAQEANASNGSNADAPSSPTSTIGSNDDDALRSGTRLVNFAVQGLDMFEQVGLVLSATIKSADKWLDSMGRRGSVTAGPSSRRASVRPVEKSQFAFQPPQSVSQHQHHQHQSQQQPLQPQPQPQPSHGFTAVNNNSNGSWAHFNGQHAFGNHHQQQHQSQQMHSIDVVMGDDMITERH